MTHYRKFGVTICSSMHRKILPLLLLIAGYGWAQSRPVPAIQPSGVGMDRATEMVLQYLLLTYSYGINDRKNRFPCPDHYEQSSTTPADHGRVQRNNWAANLAVGQAIVFRGL